MTGDILLITDQQRQAAAEILKYIGTKRKKKLTIAISGESGSGKSELSHVLAKMIKDRGEMAKVVHSDNFYITLPAERNIIRQSIGIAKAVGPHEYDWDAIYAVLDAFRKDEVVAMPCVDLLTDQVDTLFTDFRNVTFLILDGLYAIKARGIDIRVFIDIPHHMTRKAQLARGKETMDEVRAAVLRAEHLAVAALKKKATLIIDKDYRVNVP